MLRLNHFGQNYYYMFDLGEKYDYMSPSLPDFRYMTYMFSSLTDFSYVTYMS